MSNEHKSAILASIADAEHLRKIAEGEWLLDDDEVVEMADRATAARAEHAEIVKLMRALVLLCQQTNPMAFANGNTHCGADEGVVLSGRLIDDADTLLSRVGGGA